MASLSSASSFRAELLSAFGPGHGEPRPEGDRRHGAFGPRAQEAFGYPGTGHGGWGARGAGLCYPGDGPHRVIQLTYAWGQRGSLPQHRLGGLGGGP